MILYTCYGWTENKDGVQERKGASLCVAHRQEVEQRSTFDHFHTVDDMHPVPYCDHCNAEQNPDTWELHSALYYERGFYVSERLSLT